MNTSGVVRLVGAPRPAVELAPSVASTPVAPMEASPGDDGGTPRSCGRRAPPNTPQIHPRLRRGGWAYCGWPSCGSNPCEECKASFARQIDFAAQWVLDTSSPRLDIATADCCWDEVGYLERFDEAREELKACFDARLARRRGDWFWAPEAMAMAWAVVVDANAAAGVDSDDGEEGAAQRDRSGAVILSLSSDQDGRGDMHRSRFAPSDSSETLQQLEQTQIPRTEYDSQDILELRMAEAEAERQEAREAEDYQEQPWALGPSGEERERERAFAASLDAPPPTPEEEAEIARACAEQRTFDDAEAERMRCPDALYRAVVTHLRMTRANVPRSAPVERRVQALRAAGIDDRSSGDVGSIGWYIPDDFPYVAESWHWMDTNHIAFLNAAGVAKWKEHPYASHMTTRGRGSSRARAAAAAEEEAAARESARRSEALSATVRVRDGGLVLEVAMLDPPTAAATVEADELAADLARRAIAARERGALALSRALEEDATSRSGPGWDAAMAVAAGATLTVAGHGGGGERGGGAGRGDRGAQRA